MTFPDRNDYTQANIWDDQLQLCLFLPFNLSIFFMRLPLFFVYLFIHLDSVHTWYPCTLSKYGTHWALMWTQFFFKHTHVRIRARCRCPSTRSRPCAPARKWTPGPCVQQFLKAPGSPLLCSRCSAHVSKWCLTGRNGITMYTVSHISGTQSVNTTPFCAGVQSLVLGDQVWTAPSSIIYFSYFRHCFL